MKPLHCLLVAVAALSFVALAAAEPPASTKPAAETPPTTSSTGVTVAILDFSAEVAGDDNLGKQITEVLTAGLVDQAGITLVDRATLSRTLQEHELNLTGLVDADKAVQVGKLVGAKILVTGKAFSLDKSVFITAKIIGSETGLVEGIVVKGKPGGDIGDLLMQLSDKLGDRIRTAGPRLIASTDGVDPLPQLKKRLAALKLPKVDIQIREQHVSTVHAIDPPASTELRAIMADCGFTVLDSTEVNPAKAGVEIILKGEAVSEFAARIGNLNSCNARVELSVVNAADGKVLFADRITARAVDLSEQIAGKTAIQKGTHALAIKILEHFADTLPPAEKGK